MKPFSALAAALAIVASGPALAYKVPINASPQALFLRVGDGGNATYLNNNGTPGTSSEVNEVSASLTTAQLVAGTPVTMSTNTNQRRSSYDNFVFCENNQVYIGGFVRGGAANGALNAVAPASLTGAGGTSIPFSEISWTTSGIGDTGAQPIPAGAFDAAPGAQPIATFERNTWNESCLTFRYANRDVVGAGVYTGQVVYVLSAP